MPDLEADGPLLLYTVKAVRLSVNPTLRCSVLRSAAFEDLRYVSGPALALAGVSDGLPVVEPRVIR